MSVSGHKKVESIQNYTKHTSDEKKKEMSNCLASAISKTPPKKQKSEPTSMIAKVDTSQETFQTVDEMQLKDLLEISQEEPNAWAVWNSI